MLKLTKIFYFEMAHAIHGYNGDCKHIHGHSYELHVTLSPAQSDSSYIPAPGFLIDFKEIKKLVTETIIKKIDHRIVLSTGFLESNPAMSTLENLVVFEAEPTAENLLLYFRNILDKTIPSNSRLTHLKLFETKDSYAEWTEDQ